MKLRAVLLAVCGFVVCGFSAVPMRAQSSNCSDISLQLRSDNKTTSGATILSETITFGVNCHNTYYNTIYNTYTNTTTGTGGSGGAYDPDNRL